MRQDYLAALRLAVTSAETAADAQLGRPRRRCCCCTPTRWARRTGTRCSSWLEAHGHRFATADEVLADATFRDPPIDAARSGYGHYARLAKVQRAAEARLEIATLLETQAAAWNRGDLEAFCAVYAEQASFASPTGLTRGREAVLARYRTRYPDAAARGTLVLRDPGDRARLGPRAVVVRRRRPEPRPWRVGRWRAGAHLRRASRRRAA